MERELTTWPTAAMGGCASAVQVGFHTTSLLFVLLVWLHWSLEYHLC